MREGRHAELPGVRLFHTDDGEGPAVLLLHANTGTSESWAKQVPALVAAGFRAIAFDRRGWGRSLPRPETGPQPGSIAGDLEALADHLGLGRFHLVGLAGGGFAALDYAAWRPGRLLSLTVAASYGQFEDGAIRDVFARLTPPEFRALPAELRELGATFRGFDPAGTARWAAIARAARQEGAAPQPLRSPNTLAKLALIACPVLVLAGGADLYAPPTLMRRWAAHLPRQRFEVLPEAGHAPNWEQPEAFNARLIAFLREAQSSRVA